MAKGHHSAAEHARWREGIARGIRPGSARFARFMASGLTPGDVRTTRRGKGAVHSYAHLVSKRKGAHKGGH